MKIGLEIEVPFKFYFPSIHEEFLASEPYVKFSKEKILAFNKRIEAEEPSVVEKLTEFSNKHALTRGRDKYWEFVFPPVESVQIHKNTVSELVAEGLMPADIPLSLHITVSGISKPTAYAILMLLEMKFVTSERIMSGFGEDDLRLTWNKKGSAGVSTKYGVNLLHDNLAFELRTLMVSADKIGEVLDYLNDLLNNPNVLDLAKSKLKEMGLPFSVWSKEEMIRYGEYLKQYE